MVKNREKGKVNRNEREHNLLNLSYLYSDYLTYSGIGKGVGENQKIANRSMCLH